MATTRDSASETSSSSPPPEQSSSADHKQSQQQQKPPSKTRTLYNTFLSPSGSTSFFTTSWFESRPIKEDSNGKSSSSKPSSSSTSPALPHPGAGRPLKRRPSYEEYRSEEPPQARLIRLRGLFDVLMDKDQQDALAGGRAKEAWKATAGIARYGAGGKLARGSLAKEMHLDREMTGKEFELNADNKATQSTPSASSTNTNSSPKEPALPSPPRQSYAKELLTQCRQCRLDLEEERVKRSKSSSDNSEQPDSNPSWYQSIWPFTNSKDEARQASSPDQEASTLSSLWYSIAGSPQCKDDADLETNHDGESGYSGSGVWGLSAVKGGSKDRQRQRLRDENAQGFDNVADGDKSARDSASAESSDDSHHQTMIEWEGFLKYAEIKERELFKIFTELDRNCDMRLDVAEIRTALDKAGLDLPPALLDDFIASLSSSTRTADPHSPQGRGIDLWHAPRESQPTTYVSWPEFRDYLLLLPRKPSVGEIFKFYQVRKAFGLFGIGGVFSEFGSNWGSDRHSASAVTSDGDVSFGAEEKKSKSSTSGSTTGAPASDQQKKLAREAIVAAENAKDDKTMQEELQKGADAVGAATKATSGSNVVGSGGQGAAAAVSSIPGSSSDSESDDHAEEEDNDMIHSDVALKFLLAGGIAGAVSRTATAPFDRLKIYLITASKSEDTATAKAAQAVKSAGAQNAAKDAGRIASRSMGLLGTAMTTLYREGGGLKAFWLGNGLNCVKIFPESAIKFLSYETSKRAFAKYVDHVQDSRDISGTSRFISGGIGGITSQLAIYPIETLKTRLMSSQGSNAPLSSTGQRLVGNELLFATAKQMWSAGGLRVYYRGLVAGLVGVFPYSAIDMSTFEGIKLAYISYTGKEDPGTLALLAFGSISGSIGASTVYPLNLIRTRLQAAGTPAHPQVYDGFLDAVKKTYAREGPVGFYRGLVPTLAKVVPAVSISYVCYENSKKKLGVA